MSAIADINHCQAATRARNKMESNDRAPAREEIAMTHASDNNGNWQELVSGEDLSRNFVMPAPDGGVIECRFVRREARYFIAYLSSHTGCRHACRFCHLTQTGQTMMTPADHSLYLAQARRVLVHYDTCDAPAEHVNFNFMARGEALSNPAVRGEWLTLSEALGELAAARKLTHRSNISTIMPIDAANLDLAARFDDRNVAFYYSLYSLDPDFRRRWLPRADDPMRSLERLAA
jgi:adenine C2-methylase RlmN of 23S rRNA A2503 and tRNA A37